MLWLAYLFKCPPSYCVFFSVSSISSLGNTKSEDLELYTIPSNFCTHYLLIENMSERAKEINFNTSFL